MNRSVRLHAHLDGGTTIERIVATFPATHPVFVELGLDTCCGGKKPLREACADIGANYVDVLARLERAVESVEDLPTRA